MNKALILILCLLISACSSTPKQFWFESTQSLIENHKYLQALEQAKRSTPEDASLIKHINSLASKYRRKELKRLQTLLIQKQWAQADTLLFNLTQTQPKHDQFSKARTQLEQLRNKEQVEIESDVYLAKAQFLQERIRQINFDQRNTHSFFSHWFQSDPLKNEKLALTEKLIELSTIAISLDEYSLAQKTFEQALIFNEELKNQTIKQAIYQGLKKQNEATIAQRQANLVNKLKNAIENENFEKILRYSDILANPPFNDSQVQSIIKIANNILTQNALELEQLGDSVYRQGNIDSAIELWQQAQSLAPTLSSLQDKLSRAQKVQSKLEKLRQSQNN